MEDFNYFISRHTIYCLYIVIINISNENNNENAENENRYCKVLIAWMILIIKPTLYTCIVIINISKEN